MEFEVAQHHSNRPLDGTNQVLLKVVFDGSKRRVESSSREFSYVLMGPRAGAVTEAKRQELGLNREASVSAGLLTGLSITMSQLTTARCLWSIGQSTTSQYKQKSPIGKAAPLMCSTPAFLGLPHHHP
jgi:hypothetical protein